METETELVLLHQLAETITKLLDINDQPFKFKWILANSFLHWAVEKKSIELCELAKRMGANDFEWMLREAEDVEFCKLAKDWGATDFETMLYYAASQGNEEKCCLAQEWGAKNYEQMFVTAALNGHNNIVNLASKWGAGMADFELSLIKRRKTRLFNQDSKSN